MIAAKPRAEDVEAMANRQAMWLNELYIFDRRDDPDHPMQGLFTGASGEVPTVSWHLMAKSLSGQNFVPSKPKKTRQGNGSHSKPSHGRKKYRGQGKR